MNQPVISSAKNPLISQLRRLLTSGKERRQAGFVVAEGIHLAEVVLRVVDKPEMVVVAESAENNVEISRLLASLDGPRGLAIIKDSLFESLSDIHASVGILVVFAPVKLDPRPLNSDAVLLDEVQDPGNLGTILRTVAAVGINRVYLSPGSASAWSPKALRAGMGAQLGLEIYEGVDLGQLITSSSIKTLITSLNGDQSIYQADLTEPTVWVFGNEGQGVSADVAKLANQRLIIPQVTGSVESLNVSAAVAVCLYEQYRQRQ